MYFKKTMSKCINRFLLISLLLAQIVLAREGFSGSNSLKRFAVTCGAAILEGILGLSPERDKSFWHTCRLENVPIECEASCGGIRLSRNAKKERIRSCWLCYRWRVQLFGVESPWTWSPMLISTCETLGYGSSQNFVDLFGSSRLFQLAFDSTLPALLQNGHDQREGGGGGAGMEIWCGSEPIVWMGGGGGGGMSKWSRGRGTGAGLQTRFGWALGGGAGGGLEIERKNDSSSSNNNNADRKASFSFGFEKDEMKTEQREGTSDDVEALKIYMRKCYFEDHALRIYGGGGSGGSKGESATMSFNMTDCDFRQD